MKSDNPHLIIIRAMNDGGHVDILRRVQRHMLEALRESENIPFEKFYQIPKDNHHEGQYEIPRFDFARVHSSDDE